jgi:hypothetical protein
MSGMSIHCVLKAIFFEVIDKQFDDQLIVSSSKEDVRIWDIKSGVCLGVLPFQACQTLQLSNSFVGAGNAYGELIVCSRSGRQYYKMEPQESKIQALAFDESSGTLTSLTVSGHLMVQEIQGHGKLWEESLSRHHGHDKACQIELLGSPLRVQVQLRSGSTVAFGLLEGQPADPSKPSIWI